MFSFSWLSMNIVYLVFTAVYVVTFGLYSFHKLDQKLSSASPEKAKEIVLTEDNLNSVADQSKTFHYYDYFSEKSWNSDNSDEPEFSGFPSDFYPDLKDPFPGYPYFSRPPPVG